MMISAVCERERVRKATQWLALSIELAADPGARTKLARLRSLVKAMSKLRGRK